MSKLLRTVSFASASLKTLALAIVLVLCGANTVFAQLPSLVCPPAADVNCDQDLPMATVADLDGSEYTVDLTYTDAFVSGSACDSQVARTYVASFSSPDSSVAPCLYL